MSLVEKGASCLASLPSLKFTLSFCRFVSSKALNHGDLRVISLFQYPFLTILPTKPLFAIFTRPLPRRFVPSKALCKRVECSSLRILCVFVSIPAILRASF